MAANIVEYALKVKDSNAKKALKDTAKSADAAAKSTKNFGKTAGVALNNASMTAGKTRKEWMALRKDSANLDRLTGELASAFGLLHPEMGKAVSAASAVAGGAEGVIRAFTLVNMKLVAVIAAVGAVVAAYKLFTASQRKAEEETQKFQAGLQRMSDEVNKSKASLNKLNEAFENLKAAELKIGLNVDDVKAANDLLAAQKNKLDASVIAQKKNRIDIKKASRAAEAAEKARLKIAEQLRDNAFKRGEIARSELMFLQKIEDSGRKLNKNERKRKNEALVLATTARQQRREAEATIKAYESGTGAIQKMGDSLFSALLTQIGLKQSIEDQKKAEADRAKAVERYKKKIESLKKSIQEQNRALESVSKTIQSMASNTEKMNQSHVNATTKLLSTEAKTLKMQAQRLTGNQQAIALIKAENKEADARDQKLKEQTRQLNLQKIETANQITNAINLNMIALGELELLKKKTKNKKVIAQAVEKQKLAEENLKKIQIEGEKEFAAIERKRIDQSKQAEAEAEQLAERRLQERIKREKAFQAEVEKTDAVIAKGIQLIEKAAQEAAQKRIDSVNQSLQGVVAFVDDIVNPQALIQKASSAIGATFGALGSVVGDAVGGIIGGIAALGEKTPDEIKQEMEAFVEAFENGMQVLPELLIRILPNFTFAMTKAIVLAIPELIRQIGVGLQQLAHDLLEGMREIFQTEGKLSEFSGGHLRFIADFFGMSTDFRSGGRIRSARGGMRVTSGSFGAAQLAMVHPGEIITPQSGSRPQAIDRTLNQMSSGQGVTVVINSAVTEASAIDTLVRKIENRFTTFGSAKSPLFG